MGRQSAGRSPSQGGQANELGSAYRAGVAAYLAAHALASLEAEHLGLAKGLSTPRVIKVESDDAVDDLLCEATAGEILLQAKRACGIDAHFRATVDQWIAAVRDGRLRDGTHLALVTGRAKGLVRHLGSALDRRRNLDAQAPSGDEATALGHLLDAVGERLDSGQLSQLLDSAMVVELSAEGTQDAAFREAAHLLEGTVVRAGDGTAAMRALQHHFQILGARRWASDRDAWRTVLREAKLALTHDPGGGWSARRSAVEREVEDYRSRIASRRDEFALNLLSTDLPPMKVENLVGTYQVALPASDTKDSDGFAEVSRRWGRLVVVGLPGSGKTMALEQLAASWAETDGAPIPLLVSLRAIATKLDREGRSVTLALLVKQAASRIDCNGSLLVPELERLARSGEAALLLDGLDECRALAPRVADEVTRLAADLPQATSIILTTRGSSLPAAEKLRLPEVELIEPYRLDALLDELVHHIARHRIVGSDRRAWIKDRTQQLETARSEAPQLFKVPLMAVLLAMLVAEDAQPAHDRGRAQLLSDVVRDSVKRWEAHRHSDETWLVGLTDGMLLDAFSEIGHSLELDTQSTRASCEVVVAERFEAAWGRPPRAASEAATAAASFWDDRVGVFVSQPPSGVVTPRSRVFVDIAHAMWMADQPEEQVRGWIEAAVTDVERHETILLAAGLKPAVADVLIDVARESGARDVVVLAAEAVLGGAPATLAAQTMLVDLLEAALASDAGDEDQGPVAEDRTLDGMFRAMAARQARRDGNQWPIARRLARLPLDPDLWARRLRIIDALDTEEERVLGHALLSIAQASMRGDEPTDLEAERMVKLLRTPLPELETRSRRVSRRHLVIDGLSWFPLSGFGDAVVGCVRHVPHVDEELAGLAARAVHFTSMNHAVEVERQLVLKGHGALMAELSRERFGGLTDLFPDTRDWMRPYYEVVAALAQPSELTVSQAWRLENLAALTFLMDLGNSGVGELSQAFKRAPDEMKFLTSLYATSAGLDMAELAAEANIAIREHDSGSDRTVVGLLFVPPANTDSVTIHPEPLEASTLAQVMQVLRTGVELPFALAVGVLAARAGKATSHALRDLLADVPPWHRGRASRLAVFLSEDQVQTTLALLAGSDSVVQVSAAGLAAKMSDDCLGSETLLSAVDEASSAADYSMRAAVLREVESKLDKSGIDRLVGLAGDEPAYWTCTDCGHAQELQSLDCADCRTGTRPDLPESLRTRFSWYQHPR